MAYIPYKYYTFIVLVKFTPRYFTLFIIVASEMFFPTAFPSRLLLTYMKANSFLPFDLT